MKRNACTLLFLALCGLSVPLPASTLSVFILAGQSDILNWHADAARLPKSPTDGSIRFFYHTGAPPLHRKFPPNFFNATSHDAWTRLKPQTQDPYQKYFRIFFGPEMTLGRRLAAAGAGPIAIIKIGYFGTNLAEDWHPDATTGNQLYALLHRHVTHALGLLRKENRVFRVDGFFWMQGGGDGARSEFAARYEDNLTLLITRLRADFGAENTPFVLGRIPHIAGQPHREAVRAAQVKIGSTLPHLAWVDSDDLPVDTDGVHLIAPGIMTLGERMAESWLRLSWK